MISSVGYIAAKIVDSNETFQNQSVVLQDILKSLEDLNNITEKIAEKV